MSGFRRILEEHAEGDAGARGFFNELIDARGRNTSGFSTSTWRPLRAAAIA